MLIVTFVHLWLRHRHISLLLHELLRVHIVSGLVVLDARVTAEAVFFGQDVVLGGDARTTHPITQIVNHMTHAANREVLVHYGREVARAILIEVEHA